MGFALGAWDADRPPTLSEAVERYEQLRRGEDRGDASERLAAFLKDCERRWPAGDGDDDAGAVWTRGSSGGRRPSSGFVADIRQSAATDVYPEWVEMADRHGVVLYDPQSGVVMIPARLSFDADPPPSTGKAKASLRRRRRV
jgi:hypothetical protein